jgi:hypothetical protein
VASFHKDEIAVGKIGLIRFTVDAQSRTRSNISMKQRAINIIAVGRYVDCEVGKHEEVYVADCKYAIERTYGHKNDIACGRNYRTTSKGNEASGKSVHKSKRSNSEAAIMLRAANTATAIRERSRQGKNDTRSAQK